MIELNNKTYDSTSELFFEIFNDRLKLYIVWHLQKNSMRFKELSDVLSPITNKTLTVKLKELEALHLVTRKMYAEVPPRVEYSLSVQGKYLRPVIEEILFWSQKYASFIGEKDNQKNNIA
ncbi:helix-turn-helix domain-containing protein [Sulfurimonas sp. HSL-1716]|uniref:winged helix-turn-helix transcriptional regulator n=1 Tax=Hydrocurvibacter sulfurireducens TaxID=3131937 RepID=UPI0031F7CD67